MRGVDTLQFAPDWSQFEAKCICNTIIKRVMLISYKLDVDVLNIKINISFNYNRSQ